MFSKSSCSPSTSSWLATRMSLTSLFTSKRLRMMQAWYRKMCLERGFRKIQICYIRPLFPPFADSPPVVVRLQGADRLLVQRAHPLGMRNNACGHRTGHFNRIKRMKTIQTNYSPVAVTSETSEFVIVLHLARFIHKIGSFYRPACPVMLIFGHGHRGINTDFWEKVHRRRVD